jgi:hypothetical protein
MTPILPAVIPNRVDGERNVHFLRARMHVIGLGDMRADQRAYFPPLRGGVGGGVEGEADYPKCESVSFVTPQMFRPIPCITLNPYPHPSPQGGG